MLCISRAMLLSVLGTPACMCMYALACVCVCVHVCVCVLLTLTLLYRSSVHHSFFCSLVAAGHSGRESNPASLLSTSL